MVTADDWYPDGGGLVDFFLQSRAEKFQTWSGIERPSATISLT